VNRLANNARQLNLGHVDMRQLREDKARHTRTTGNRPYPAQGAGPEQTIKGPVPSSQNLGTNYPDQEYQPKLSAAVRHFAALTC